MQAQDSDTADRHATPTNNGTWAALERELGIAPVVDRAEIREPRPGEYASRRVLYVDDDGLLVSHMLVAADEEAPGREGPVMASISGEREDHQPARVAFFPYLARGCYGCGSSCEEHDVESSEEKLLQAMQGDRDA